MKLLLIVAGISGIIVLPLLAIDWILRPLRRRRQAERLPKWHFTLSDSMCLAALALIAIGVLYFFVRRDLSAVRIVLNCVFFFYVNAWWFAFLRELNEAGIRDVKRRAAMLVLIMPGALLASLGLVPAWMVWAIGISARCVSLRHFIPSLDASVLPFFALMRIIAARLATSWVAQPERSVTAEKIEVTP